MFKKKIEKKLVLIDRRRPEPLYNDSWNKAIENEEFEVKKAINVIGFTIGQKLPIHLVRSLIYLNKWEITIVKE